MHKQFFTFVFGCLLCIAPRAEAFVLLGPGTAEGNTPVKDWQGRGPNGGWLIGYGFPGDIGAPVDPIEAYRWNVPVITYAFEASFLDYFGTNGVRAVEEAFQILNDLPAVSKMSADLREFPLTTLRQNYEAAQFGLIDVKSTALTLILEEMGLAQADRWIWSLRRRIALQGPDNPAAYDVIRYNIDPVTLERSSYINETLYTYTIVQVPPPGPLTPYAYVSHTPIPPDAIPNPPVSSLSAFIAGNYYAGLTRDDVGGLRFLWNPKRVVAESLLPGSVVGVSRASAPYIGTNFLGTNAPVVGTNAVTAALRGGINKVRFQRVRFDSGVGGTFTAITNSYKDRVIQGNTGKFQDLPVLRPIQSPDFIFTVTDLGQGYMTRTDTSSWINNDLLTPSANLGGPGIISPSITISFNMLDPFFQNETPDFIGEFSAFYFNGGWASFDGTTNAPILYPQYLHTSMRDLRSSAQQQGGF